MRYTIHGPDSMYLRGVDHEAALIGLPCIVCETFNWSFYIDLESTENDDDDNLSLVMKNASTVQLGQLRVRVIQAGDDASSLMRTNQLLLSCSQNEL